MDKWQFIYNAMEQEKVGYSTAYHWWIIIQSKPKLLREFNKWYSNHTRIKTNSNG